MLSSGPPRPGTGVRSKWTVELRLPRSRLNAFFGDPDASSKIFRGKFCYPVIHTTRQTKQTEWNIHPRKKFSEFNLSTTSNQQAKGRAGQERIQSTRILHGLAVGNQLSTGSLSGHQVNPGSRSRSTGPQLHKRSHHHRRWLLQFGQIHAQRTKTATN